MQDELDDPIFARLAAARPEPPPALISAIDACLPVRAPPSKSTVGLAAVTAVVAIVVLFVVRDRRDVEGSAESRDALSGAHAVDGGAVDQVPRDAATADAPRRV